MITKDQTTIKKKYYYYVAIISKNGSIAYTKGTVSTVMNDFPLLEIENYIMKNYKVPRVNVIITFYKEITEENYESYNNE